MISIMNRRTFVKSPAWAAGGWAAMKTMKQSNHLLGANEVIRVAVVGIRSRGWAHVLGFNNVPGVEVVALCDVDSKVLAQRAGELETLTGHKVKRYGDMRGVFDNQEIDAVSFATPNHWHSLGGIWAMEAGKHTYVEKPCSHNVWEGRQLVKASRKYNRLCQHGTQGRCSPAIREAIQKLREGAIGQVYMARGVCYKWRPSIGKVNGPLAAPQEVDYNLWLGPAPEKPVYRSQFHYDWHWQWDYGNGDMGNQGVHEMDLARWGLGVGLPKQVQATGGHFMFEDNQETPNVLLCTFEYPDQNKILQFETRHWIGNYEGNFGSKGGNNVGVLFYGSEGYMELEYFKYRIFLGKNREPGPSGSGEGDSFRSFIDAVRSGRQEDLGVDIEEGHLSSTLCHLGNIAYRTHRTIRFDPATEKILGDDEANSMLRRTDRAPFLIPAI